MELFGGVKESTKKLYTHNLKKLNDDKEIKDLKSEIEAIKSASQKEMDLIKASSQNHYISLQKIKKDY
jgi:hypothetical protein